MGANTTIGNMGSIAGSLLYPSTDGPQYQKGHYLCFGMAVATAVISLTSSIVLRAVNRHRDRKYRKPIRACLLMLRRKRTATRCSDLFLESVNQ